METSSTAAPPAEEARPSKLSTTRIVVWFLLFWPVGLYYLVRRLGGAKALAIALPVVAVFPLHWCTDLNKFNQ